jgi:hypothetical protein
MVDQLPFFKTYEDVFLIKCHCLEIFGGYKVIYYILDIIR